MGCAICKDKNIEPKEVFETDEFIYDCQVCGKYKITRTAKSMVEGLSIQERNKLSFKTRKIHEQGSVLELDSKNIKSIPESFNSELNVFETIDKLLLFVAHRQKKPSKKALILPVDSVIIYTTDSKELNFYISETISLGYLKKIHDQGNHYSLTLKGWEKVISLQSKQVDSKKAFVAMWFSDEVDSVWEDGFFPALNELGYEPLRIDKKEHNDKIDDHIIAEIRKSGLLIADFTGNRNGVYFEAGFAMGLGIPVIWTCRKDHIDNVHFDTRQYNHIVWETPEELMEKLTYRIEATIPNRPTPRKPEAES
jgi:nucleoside 2-deoxyribosyltransferase